MIGYAVVGLGIGQCHVDAVLNNKNAKLVAVCDLRQDRLDLATDGYPEITQYTDFDEMIKRTDIDIVSICLPSSMHAEFAIKAMKTGKHVLIEKPIDITADIAKEIEKVRLETGVKVGIVHQNRFNSCMDAIKYAIDSGRFGKLFLANFAIKWLRGNDYYNNGWHGTWAIDGGGSLINQAVHTIDIMQWLMGEVESVTAHIDVVNHNIETEDLTATLIKFKSGALATFVTTTCAYPGLSTDVQIYGLDGSVELDADNIKLWKMKNFSEDFAEKFQLDAYDTGDEEEEMLTKYGNNVNLLQNFPEKAVGHQAIINDMIDAVINDRQPRITPNEAIKSVKIVNAIYESAKTGKTIFID